jgi:putative endonuclease
VNESCEPARAKTWWLYLLQCRDDRLYAGIALDIAARFELHRSGKGARFTRANPPRSVLAAQPFATRGEALRAEYALKQLSRPEKLRWADQWRCPAEKTARATQRTQRKTEITKR